MVRAGKLLDATEDDEGTIELEAEDNAELDDGGIMSPEDAEALDIIGKLPGATTDDTELEDGWILTTEEDTALETEGLDDGLGSEEPPPPPQPDSPRDTLSNAPKDNKDNLFIFFPQ